MFLEYSLINLIVSLSSEKCNFERYQLQREFSMKNGLYLVLKGAHSGIAAPDGRYWFNTSGNPGMATGGSGDVLTGMLAGLVAQGHSIVDSAIIAVYIHGLTADHYILDQHESGLTPFDLIQMLPQTIKKLF